jgi:hypothetical protein
MHGMQHFSRVPVVTTCGRTSYYPVCGPLWRTSDTYPKMNVLEQTRLLSKIPILPHLVILH